MTVVNRKHNSGPKVKGDILAHAAEVVWGQDGDHVWLDQGLAIPCLLGGSSRIFQGAVSCLQLFQASSLYVAVWKESGPLLTWLFLPRSTWKLFLVHLGPE